MISMHGTSFGIVTITSALFYSTRNQTAKPIVSTFITQPLVKRSYQIKKNTNYNSCIHYHPDCCRTFSTNHMNSRHFPNRIISTNSVVYMMISMDVRLVMGYKLARNVFHPPDHMFNF